MTNKNNLQYRRTDKAIINAFIKICKQKKFEQITVKDILDEALVSRNTFYAHYKDKYEIVEILFSDFLNEFHAFLKQTYKTDKRSLYHMATEERAMEINQRLKKFYEEHAEILNVLMRINTTDFNMQKSFKEFFASRYMQENAMHSNSTLKTIEAEIYGYIEVALSEVELHNTFEERTNTDLLTEAVISAVLFAVGLRNHDTCDRLKNEIMKCRFEEMSSYDL